MITSIQRFRGTESARLRDHGFCICFITVSCERRHVIVELEQWGISHTTSQVSHAFRHWDRFYVIWNKLLLASDGFAPQA